MVRVALILIVLAAVAASVPGFATTVGLTPDTLGNGNAGVSTCDTSFTYTYTTVGGNVTSVNVGGIADPTCTGGSLQLTLTNGAGASLGGGGPVTIPAGGSVAVPTSTPVDGELVAGARVAIVGP
jgi:hypothetical protein